MLRTYTCIICPNGCEITAKLKNGEIRDIEGALCPRGKEYVTQELTDPRRNIATSVLLEGGQLPLVIVRLSGPIPKDRIFDVMNAIRPLRLKAPVHVGQVALPNVLGLGVDVLVTKEVAAL